MRSSSMGGNAGWTVAIIGLYLLLRWRRNRPEQVYRRPSRRLTEWVWKCGSTRATEQSAGSCPSVLFFMVTVDADVINWFFIVIRKREFPSSFILPQGQPTGHFPSGSAFVHSLHRNRGSQSTRNICFQKNTFWSRSSNVFWTQMNYYWLQHLIFG